MQKNQALKNFGANQQAQDGQLSIDTQAIKSHLERILDPKDVLVVSVEDFQNHIAFIKREDIQITLPETDIFSEEMRVIVTNTGGDSIPGSFSAQQG